MGMAGAVTLPEAIVEAVIWLLELGIYHFVPKLKDYIENFRDDIKDICREEGTDFAAFERRAINGVIRWDCVGTGFSGLPWKHRQKVLAALRKKGIYANLQKTGFWVIYYMERHYTDQFFKAILEYRDAIHRALETCKDPNILEKGIAGIEWIFTNKYQPKGSVSLPELRELGWYGKCYRESKTGPKLVSIVRNAKLDTRRVRTLARGMRRRRR
jgi:hypothetical protein